MLSQAKKVRHILNTYKAASGQKINLDKSIVIFSKNTSSKVIGGVAQLLGVSESDKHEKYLGFPVVMGRSKKEVFPRIREQVWKKVKGWKQKLISKADMMF